MISYEDNNFVESFINKVFNFYNGRINVCNPATLYIEWAELRSSSNGGTTLNPNIVVIYPSVIKRYAANRFHFFYLILETIIHELFHIDQVIDYLRTVYDIEYLKYIEYAVETQTALYIVDHRQEICQKFGLDISADSDFYRGLINKYSMGNTYHRKDYITHFICILREILGYSGLFDHDYEAIKNNIQSRSGAIIVKINNNVIEIQRGDKLASINDINNFFYSNYFYGNYRKSTLVNFNTIFTKGSPVIINIDISAEIRNIMCKILN